jgi:hypothetical protein
MRYHRTREHRSLGSLGALGAATLLVGVRGEVANANVALILVVCVLLGAWWGGRAAGSASAFVAALAFDFFHTRPYNSLKMADGNDIITAILLMVVGFAVGEIAVRGRAARAARDDERRSLHRLDRITGLVSRGTGVDELVDAVRAELVGTLGLRDCYFERAPYLGRFDRMERTGIATGRIHRYTREGFELSRDGIELPVEGAGEMLGRFVLLPTPGFGVSPGRRMIAIAIADQLGSALARRAA